MAKHTKSKKQVGLDRTQDSTNKRSAPWIIVGVIAFVVAGLGMNLIEYVRVVPGIVVLSNCSDAFDASLKDKTIALPSNCKAEVEGAYYWHDPHGTYDFKNFAPCQDEEGRIACVPLKKHAAFVDFKQWKEGSKLLRAVRFSPESSVSKMFRFQFGKATGPMFYGSGLLYKPLMYPSNVTEEMKAKTGVYNFIITPSNENVSLIVNTFLEQSVEKLCETGNSVNMVHLGLDLDHYQAYNKSCVNFVELNITQECDKYNCTEFFERRFLQDQEGQYFAVHLQAFLRTLVGLKFGGWIIEPGTLIKTPFIPERELVFLYDDHANSTVPTTHLGYFEKNSPFLTDVIRNFARFYNKDCYGCSDTALTKFIISKKQYDLDIGAAEFYLPQLSSDHIYQLYVRGKFDNDVYNHFQKAPFTFWNLRYAKSIAEDYCAQSNLLYSLLADQIIGKELCK